MCSGKNNAWYGSTLVTWCKCDGEAKDIPPLSLLVPHTRMPGVEFFSLLMLWCSLHSWCVGPLQQQHMALSLETPHRNEKVKSFSALGLAKKG